MMREILANQQKFDTDLQSCCFDHSDATGTSGVNQQSQPTMLRSWSKTSPILSAKTPPSNTTCQAIAALQLSPSAI
jgi:hypothetical protein